MSDSDFLAGLKGRPPRNGASGRWFACAPFCLILTVLPFLLTHGRTGTVIPAFESAAAYVPGFPDRDDPPSADEQDVCNPAPLDSDPSEDETGMALCLDAHTRRDYGVFSAQANADFRFPLPSGAAFPRSANEGRGGEAPELPYFPDYPVFLIGDLPPPSA